MSPVMSMMRAAVAASRTSKVVACSGIGAPLVGAGGAVLVVGDGHEVREPGDLENPPVVLREAEGPHLDPALAGTGQQAHDQGDPCAVDVVDVAEVQGDLARGEDGVLVAGVQ